MARRQGHLPTAAPLSRQLPQPFLTTRWHLCHVLDELQTHILGNLPLLMTKRETEVMSYPERLPSSYDVQTLPFQPQKAFRLESVSTQNTGFHGCAWRNRLGTGLSPDLQAKLRGVEPPSFCYLQTSPISPVLTT